ncbi:MAG TPA: PH domain-containing protein [Rhodoglobus sp.]|nr:PH domain-containing protein [Rhodoglobus sp.]
MSESAPPPELTAGTPAAHLADGEWHRLHPATPLLRGGLAFVAILGVIVVNLRDLWIEILIGGPQDEGVDPLTFVIENGYLGIGLLILIGGLLLSIGAFYLSWRMNTFRITDELVEVRSGILFRTHRRGRLDRIQGVNIVRPFLARIFGTAKLEINVAGQDANVPLSYLGSAAADDLRREILTLASGTQAREAAAGQPVSGGLVERRLNEFVAEYADEGAPESIVRMHPGRLLGSIALNAVPVAVVVTAGIVIGTTLTGELFFLLGFIPGAIGMAGYYVNRFTKFVRYSISATPDGIRVGYGLLSTANDTLPPGRIHAVQLYQPLFWRPFGWWDIRINRASQSAAQAASGQSNFMLLPVGSLDDVRRVLGLVFPDLAESDILIAGLKGRGEPGDGFVNSPKRARLVRWFSQRRNGFALEHGVVLFRHGYIWRDLAIVPSARMQSVALQQGPLARSLRLANLRLHTVSGPVTASLGAVDRDAAVAFFGDVAHAAVTAAESDVSHRWRAPHAQAEESQA